uniref:Galactosyltransferase C-terminal domain-containing protein n=1 Tax=viral metagenome TaxID=1070528 RepID=A0A6C0I8U7_9ZZZZ
MNVSLIIPYYKKYNEFQKSLEFNKCQYSLAQEVILIVDHPVVEGFSFFKKNYPEINFRIFVNQTEHSWRNPSVVINFGISQCKSNYCIIISPETILLEPNSIKLLIENTNENNFSVGRIIFLRNDLNFENNSFINKPLEINCELLKLFKYRNTRKHYIIGPVYYGSICCSKKNLNKVNNYTEDFTNWGGEDDDIRNKLIKSGITCNKIPEVCLLHVETPDEFENRFKINSKKNNDNIINNFVEIV